MAWITTPPYTATQPDSGPLDVPPLPPPRGSTNRVLRTLGAKGDDSDVIRKETRELADLSVFRRYPALFHKMASRRRPFSSLLELSLYDLLVIGGLLLSLGYVLWLAMR